MARRLNPAATQASPRTISATAAGWPCTIGPGWSGKYPVPPPQWPCRHGPPLPTALGTRGVGAKVQGGVHRPGVAGRGRQGLGPSRRRWSRRARLLVTQGPGGLVRQALERFGLGGTLALGRDGLGWCLGSSTGCPRPAVGEPAAQPQQDEAHPGRVDKGGASSHGPLPWWCRGTMFPGCQATGMISSAQVHIWTRSPCQGALEWTNTLRDRCSHISGLVVKTAYGLGALMKSALPRLITTAASGALYLRRLGGSRSDLSCHQFDHTSHCAEELLDLSIKSKYCSNTCQRPF